MTSRLPGPHGLPTGPSLLRTSDAWQPDSDQQPMTRLAGVHCDVVGQAVQIRFLHSGAFRPSDKDMSKGHFRTYQKAFDNPFEGLPKYFEVLEEKPG